MLKEMKKKLHVAVALLSACCMLLAGCGASLTPADQNVNALVELIVNDNAVPMKDLLGFASEDDVRSSFIEDEANMDLVDSLAEEFTDLGIEFTDEELQEMSDSMSAMLKKVTYSTEITSEEKDKVTVTVKMNGFTEDQLSDSMLEIAESATENISEEDLALIASGDEEASNAFVHQIFKDYMNAMAALEPTSEQSEITVECEKLQLEVSGKNKIAWLPSDMTKFETDIENCLFK